MTVCPPDSQSVDCDSYNLTQTLLNISDHHGEDTVVHLEPGNYTLDEEIYFKDIELSIIGKGDPTEIIISCQQIKFKMVSNLIMSNFTLSNCGPSISSEIPFYSALYIDECTNITLSNVPIVNTQGVGLYATNLHGHCVFDRLVLRSNNGGGVSLNFNDSYSSEKFSYNKTITLVEFIECNFMSNVVDSDKPNFLNGGGGLKVTLSQASYQVNLRLITSHFQYNTAKYGAGAFLYMTSPLYCGSICPNDIIDWNVSIENCSFANNNASFGGSALLVYKDNNIINSGGVFVISNCKFMSNIAAGNKNPPTQTLHQFKGTTVSIRHTNISLEGNNEFALNYGTALEAINGQVSVCGNVYVHSNIATHGGGFRLLGNAYILLYLNDKNCNSLLKLTDNSAYVGSAVYVGAGGNDWIEDLDPCFLHFDISGKCPNNFDSINAPVIVLNDIHKEEFGIFGSTLEQCEWIQCDSLHEHGKTTVYEDLKNLGILKTTFAGDSLRYAGDSLRNAGDSLRNDSSLVDRVRLYAYNITVMPGQTFEISVELLDMFEKAVSGIVSATVVNGDAGFVKDGPWFIDDQITVLQLSLEGMPEQLVTLSVYEVFNVGVHAEFTVMLQPCLLGFMFDSVKKQCACDEEFANEGIYCDTGSDTFNIPSEIWLGPLNNDNNSTLVTTHCVEDYCKSSTTSISNEDFDFQCISDRTGVGCGSCVSTHSVVFGSTQCKMCTNYSLFMIALFLFTGMLTVTGILFLRITITEGYLNAVLFYCNIITVYAVYFVPAEHGKGAFFLAAWISQQFGIPACFYDGMTTLASTGLHLLYIVYLFILTVLLSLLLRCKQLPQSDSFAPSKALATLLVICYTSLLETCLKIMSFTIVRALDGEVFIRWYFDANVKYFGGIHAALAVVSILIILFFLIPFPLLIISPRITYRVRFFNKLQPLLDTFWAPFKPKFRWWLSFRLFLRWIPFFVVSFVSDSKYSIVSVIITLTILHFMQSLIKPFKSHWQNTFDEALVLNTILLFCGYLFFESNSVGLEVYSGVFVGITYLVFGVLFVPYMFYRFPKCKPFLKSLPTKVRNFFSPSNVLNIQEADIKPPKIVSHSEITISKEEKEQDRRNLNEDILELESLSAAESSPNSSPTHAMINPSARVSNTESLMRGESHYRVSLTERKDDKNSFPLLNRRNSFTEDREPLLADDSQ